MLDQIPQKRIGKTVLIGPLGVPENPVERVRICLLDSAHGGLQCLANVHRDLADIPPMAPLGDLKCVVFRKKRGLLVASELRQGGFMLLVVDVGNPFEEKEWKNVCFEVRSIDRPAQNVRCLPKVRLELGEFDGSRMFHTLIASDASPPRAPEFSDRS